MYTNFFTVDFIRLEVLSADKGNCTAEFTVQEEQLNYGGSLHGGCTCSLVDSVSTYALMTHAKNPHPGVSVDLHVSHPVLNSIIGALDKLLEFFDPLKNFINQLVKYPRLFPNMFDHHHNLVFALITIINPYFSAVGDLGSLTLGKFPLTLVQVESRSPQHCDQNLKSTAGIS
ncbi:Similar to ACOT13: Acyl-coenzyme A thioesterase 13 (Pongo abelii) [Cotesia congregata]|uniref:Similar to ACOT13: Acyl-coenzyme A thioesterase 13 (Pongo abelii) n=1 Tax=Cotesia congregata TaxID=51543 RepID=A0A8J2MGZ5_COTCN|nr:Similar to ACOT13: Acyl-coenzyme A thioesterase 13 (Pongo abelii) [Cotesia congregata]